MKDFYEFTKKTRNSSIAEKDKQTKPNTQTNLRHECSTLFVLISTI